MAEFKLSAAVVGTLILLGMSATADAQTVRSKPAQQNSFTARETPTAPQDPLAPQATRKSLQWDGRSWGMRLDVDQQANRDTRLKDAEVGAFYRLTPSLHIGGAVGLADKTPTPKPIETDQTTPRVRLETTLKF